jgi:hypothetical protein
MEYREFIASVHSRYSLYGATVTFPTCLYERLSEERPDIVARLSKTGRKVTGRTGKVKFSQEIWDFIRDVW